MLGATAVLVVTGACSSDDAKDDEDKDSETTTTVAEQTTSTMTDEAFSSGLTEFSAAIEASGTDLCAMGEAQALIPQAPPANEAQMEEFIGVYAGVFRSYATALGDDQASADALNTAADELIAEAEAAGYPTDFLSGEDPTSGPKAMTSEPFIAANQALTTKFQAECAPEEPAGEAPADEAPATTAAP